MSLEDFERPSEPPLPEVWLRGPLDGYPLLLMPVAHALLQAREDIERLARTVRPQDVWTRVGAAASIGFHVQHVGGSIDRLCTYARGEPLSVQQLRALKGESDASGRSLSEVAAETLATLDRALHQVRTTTPEMLTEPRKVGRAGLPSTVIGLLVHVAEHTTRHAGQAITTAAILRGLREEIE
jgi:DinB superfamily